jgi:pimeloyl-ACP methyl ester carboxylesterase
MPFVEANGINIYYEVEGQGEPLVLITGLSYALWYWHRIVPLLAKQFRVITFDNRGVGQSDAPPGPYTAAMMAADTADLLDALGIERAHVLGHSMGGYVAQALALDYPQRIDRLVLASTNFGGPEQIPPSAEAMAILTDVSSDPAERFRRGLKISTAPDFAGKNQPFIEEWLAYREENPIEPVAYQAQLAVGLALLAPEGAFDGRLHQITAPTLLLAAEHDGVVPPDNAALMAAQIPDSTVVILPGAGHHFALEIPEVTAETITGFLQGGGGG